MDSTAEARVHDDTLMSRDTACAWSSMVQYVTVCEDCKTPCLYRLKSLEILKCRSEILLFEARLGRGRGELSLGRICLHAWPKSSACRLMPRTGRGARVNVQDLASVRLARKKIPHGKKDLPKAHLPKL